MTRTKVFKSNKSQAVRLPKSVAFPDEIQEVEIVTIGNTRVISPIDQSWDTWFEDKEVTQDYMNSRKQPKLQKRATLDD